MNFFKFFLAFVLTVAMVLSALKPVHAKDKEATVIDFVAMDDSLAPGCGKLIRSSLVGKMLIQK